jgi:hypothetical protein
LLLCCSALVMGLSLLVLAVVMYSRENGGSMGQKFEGALQPFFVCRTSFNFESIIWDVSFSFYFELKTIKIRNYSIEITLQVEVEHFELFAKQKVSFFKPFYRTYLLNKGMEFNL